MCKYRDCKIGEFAECLSFICVYRDSLQVNDHLQHVTLSDRSIFLTFLSLSPYRQGPRLRDLQSDANVGIVRKSS